MPSAEQIRDSIKGNEPMISTTGTKLLIVCERSFPLDQGPKHADASIDRSIGDYLINLTPKHILLSMFTGVADTQGKQCCNLPWVRSAARVYAKCRELRSFSPMPSKDILKNADLRTLSSKQVRLQLQCKFGLDLSSRKQEIDDILMSIINENDTETAGASSAQNESKSASESSSSDSDDSGPIENTTSGKRKRQEKSGAAKRAADVSDVSSGVQLDDEALARKLHNEELRVRQRKLDKKGKRVKNGKSEDGSASTPAAPKKGKSVYSQECVLSPELASVMGTDKVSSC
ncbi:unnamed protein product [Soboliphyme baturini]|uniref:DEK_C domain-containing protein n=1 Tax=Soboliphyme baturini TaxID=241478 RepID=A0A183INU7_9BILA|nr:unnamed protein product [Soboliphyme baturini]